jgi:hypothetical protein
VSITGSKPYTVSMVRVFIVTPPAMVQVVMMKQGCAAA